MTKAQVRIVDSDGVHSLCFSPPILSRDLLRELSSALQALASRAVDARPLVVCSDHTEIFLAGAHLGEIAELTSESSLEYARLGRKTLRQLTSHPQPVVAAVHGPCAGGGFDLALHCDRIVGGPNAVFSHPGARRGLVTAWRGSAILKRTLDLTLAEAVLVEGRALVAADLARFGLAISAPSDPIATAESEARRLAGLNRQRLSLWRGLKTSEFIDRFRVSVVHNDM